MTIAGGIIAAGEGSRLAAAHPGVPKPLVEVAGAPLCRWIVDSLAQAEITELTILLNSRGKDVRSFLERSFAGLTWTFLEKDTSSSWASFRLVAESLARTHADFLISTIDAILAPGEVARFCRTARASGCGAALALTDFIDDEKPLWADLTSDGRIAALGTDAKGRRYATAGLYYLTSRQAGSLSTAGSFDSLRGFLSALVRQGPRIAGVPVSKSIDVDRPEDIAAAEDFLRETRTLT